MAAGNFDVRTDRQAEALVVMPRGEMDLATVGLVREAVDREHRGEKLVLDLRAVGFMDTSGLRCVLELNDRAAREGFELKLIPGPEAVQRVFEVSGLAPRLPFVDEAAAVTGPE